MLTLPCTLDGWLLLLCICSACARQPSSPSWVNGHYFHFSHPSRKAASNSESDNGSNPDSNSTMNRAATDILSIHDFSDNAAEEERILSALETNEKVESYVDLSRELRYYDVGAYSDEFALWYKRRIQKHERRNKHVFSHRNVERDSVVREERELNVNLEKTYKAKRPHHEQNVDKPKNAHKNQWDGAFYPSISLVPVPKEYLHDNKSQLRQSRKEQQTQRKQQKDNSQPAPRREKQPRSDSLISLPKQTASHHGQNVGLSVSTAVSQRGSFPSSRPAPQEEAGPWLHKFLSCYRAKQEMLLLVPLDFLLDSFNLALLAPVVESIVHNYYCNHSETSANLLTDEEVGEHNSPHHSFLLYRRALQLLTSHLPLQLNQQARQKDGEDGQILDSTENGAMIEMAAVVLYCLVHQRYVLSPRGLEALRWQFLGGYSPAAATPTPTTTGDNFHNNNNNNIHSELKPVFGRCPKPDCRGMPLLPAGSDGYLAMSSLEGHGNANSGSFFRYCGRCQNYWMHWTNEQDDIDAQDDLTSPMTALRLGHFIQGCAWGLSLGPLFHLSFPGFLRSPESQGTFQLPRPPPTPRIFDFCIHPSVHIYGDSGPDEN